MALGKKKKDDGLRLLAMTPQMNVAQPTTKGPVDMKEKAEEMMGLKKDMDEQYENIMLKIKKRFLEQGHSEGEVAFRVSSEASFQCVWGRARRF
eukprot:symbB.v1.2.027916.t2/scaffold2898.1/size67682/5